MTNQPVQGDGSAAGWEAEVWAAPDNANSINSAGPNSDLPRVPADGHELCCNDDDKSNFDLLMENASHSDEFRGYEFAQPVGGRLFGGDTTALAANRSQKACCIIWSRLSGLRPTGGR